MKSYCAVFEQRDAQSCREIIRVERVVSRSGIPHVSYQTETFISGRTVVSKKTMALEEFVRKFSLNKRVAEQLSSNPGDQIEEVRLVQESKARTLIPANGSASDIH